MPPTALPPDRSEALNARGTAAAQAPFEAYRPKLLVGLSVGAALALVAGGTAAALDRPLGPLELVAFATALALFCGAPVLLYWTGSALPGTALLLAGGVPLGRVRDLVADHVRELVLGVGERQQAA